MNKHFISTVVFLGLLAGCTNANTSTTISNNAGGTSSSANQTTSNMVTSTTSSATQVTSGIVQSQLGFRSSAALSATGRLFTWGLNLYGQLGDNTTSTRNTPTEITSRFTLVGNDKVVLVRLGNDHSAVLTSSGRVWTWGRNHNGQLGDGTITNRSIPTDITGNFNLVAGEKIIDIALGRPLQTSTDGHRTAAYTSNGRVFIWGNNFAGQIGDGTIFNQNQPIDITSIFSFQANETIVDLQIGANHQILITSLGRVMMWGSNTHGQLGDGTKVDKKTPVDITSAFNLVGEEKITSVRLGGNFSTAMSSTNRVFLWGNSATELNALGVVAGETTTPIDATSALNVVSGDQVAHVRIGSNHAGILTKNGQVWLWGGNGSGQIGNNTTTTQSTPVNITSQFNLQNNERVVTLELGLDHSSATTSLGRLFMWGRRDANGSAANTLTPGILNIL
jgi:alpha-tubulin suppressor-like RCC1 family protein